MTDGPTIFKERQRAAWSSGNWDVLSVLVADVGPDLLDRLGVTDGEDLLDVGTGSGGSIPVPAALRGANVVGSDLTPAMFDAARARAAAVGVDVEWVEADAESLPFEDARFDVVTSTFGHMFAPRHAVAAGEMVRVLRPGGRLGCTTWPPDSGTARTMTLMGRYLPAPPEGVESPLAWGNVEHVRGMFEPHGIELEFGSGTAVVEFDDIDAFYERFDANFGPGLVAMSMLGDKWAQVRRERRALQDEFITPIVGGYRLRQDYLVTIGSKPA